MMALMRSGANILAEEELRETTGLNMIMAEIIITINSETMAVNHNYSIISGEIVSLWHFLNEG